jgi:hypothetical protein
MLNYDKATQYLSQEKKAVITRVAAADLVIRKKRRKPIQRMRA